MGNNSFFNNRHPEEAPIIEILSKLLQNVENEVIEFKLASNNFDSHKLGQYFSAISNEANLKNKQFGWLVFGVDDKTHIIKGSNYKNSPVAIENLKHEIAQSTTGAITFMDIFELHPIVDNEEKRVVMFKIPAAAIAIPTGWKNRYYGRDGESLVDLSQEKIDRIRGERRIDWSREIVEGATFDHLDPSAIALARKNYREKLTAANNPAAVQELDAYSDIQFLKKLKLIRDGKITKAAFVLFSQQHSAHIVIGKGSILVLCLLLSPNLIDICEGNRPNFFNCITFFFRQRWDVL